jgi:hypothetical protein
VDTASSSTPGPETWSEQFRQSLLSQRGRLRELFIAHQQRWKEAATALTEQIECLEQQLTEARAEVQRLLGQGESDQPGPLAAGDDFRRRYELALEDIRELRTRNAELQEQVTGNCPHVAEDGTGALDWEAEKRRVLADLELLAEAGAGPQQADRLQIAEALRAADLAVAEKDRHIEQLRAQIENQRREQAAPPDPAATSRVLDQDALVQEERQNLKRLQEEWREKLCRAEIDISQQRAEIARQRAQLEAVERLRDMGKCPHTDGADHDGSVSTHGGKARRGRWLAKLGLKDLDPPSAATH